MVRSERGNRDEIVGKLTRTSRRPNTAIPNAADGVEFFVIEGGVELAFHPSGWDVVLVHDYVIDEQLQVSVRPKQTMLGSGLATN